MLKWDVGSVSTLLSVMFYLARSPMALLHMTAKHDLADREDTCGDNCDDDRYVIEFDVNWLDDSHE